jgi:hypothetical protein
MTNFPITLRLDAIIMITAISDLLEIARKERKKMSDLDGDGRAWAVAASFMELGVAASIRARLDPKRILNRMPTDQLLEWAATVRDRSHHLAD